MTMVAMIMAFNNQGVMNGKCFVFGITKNIYSVKVFEMNNPLCT